MGWVEGFTCERGCFRGDSDVGRESGLQGEVRAGRGGALDHPHPVESPAPDRGGFGIPAAGLGDTGGDAIMVPAAHGSADSLGRDSERREFFGCGRQAAALDQCVEAPQFAPHG